MLNGDRSQWRIEELRAVERAEMKRWVDVCERAAQLMLSSESVAELIEEDTLQIADAIVASRGRPHLTIIVKILVENRALTRAEREIPPVSLQDIADELAGEVSHEID